LIATGKRLAGSFGVGFGKSKEGPILVGAFLQVQPSAIANVAGEIKVLVAEGQLDLDTCAALQGELDALVDGTGRRLLLDLSRLAFIDSVGIATLYRATASFARMAVVVVPGSRVGETLETCGMDQLLPLVDSRTEAVRALA
jgi:anti-anti-sigma factor